MEQNVRPDFYEGQYLGADDLDAVVDYERIQQARHTLGPHTWGIGAGLELRERKLPSGDVDVSILPGIAWDGYGRTIVVLAPAAVSAEKFVNFQADTPADGQPVKVWLRYAETPTRKPAAGFEVCRPDGQFSRVVESFAVEVGEATQPAHGSVIVAGRSMDARKVRSAFVTGAPDLFDESVPYQAFPEGGSRPIWLVPIGYVRWLKTSGQPGRLIPRSDSGLPRDSDLIRAFRQYVGVVAEAIDAADGLIRLRDRGQNPNPLVSPPKPPDNDLAWVEGNLHVLGDLRVSGGKIELRNPAASTDGVPLALRRVEANSLGGKDIQVVIGTANTPQGTHAFAVGPGKIDPVTGELKADFSRRFVVRDDGTVGVGIDALGADAPPQLLTLGGDKKTRLEIGRISTSLPWPGDAGQSDNGSFAINQQSQGSENPGADLALMRDRKLRLVLGDNDTYLSSQGGHVRIFVNCGEQDEKEVMRITKTANVGIGTSAPAAKLHVDGSVRCDGDVTVSGVISSPASKNFLIPHPLAPATNCLVHASLEGPEAAVFYRGEARLDNGRATVVLPAYFEALTREDERTVLVTPIVDVEEDDPASALGATRVAGGRFTVRMITPGNPSQRFCWEVKALRADLPPLQVEVDRGARAEPVSAASRGR